MIHDQFTAGRRSDTLTLSFAPDAIETWPLAKLEPYAKNARMRGADQVAKIAASMAEFGWTVPCLDLRVDVEASVLSGGVQQMPAMCWTLTGDPDLVIVDEPTEGLSPQMVQRVAELLQEIARCGIATLLVEQKLSVALYILHRVNVMGYGKVVFEGTPEDLKARENVRNEWLEV